MAEILPFNEPAPNQEWRLQIDSNGDRILPISIDWGAAMVSEGLCGWN